MPRERYSFILLLTPALDGGEWLTPRPRRFTPGKVSRYPFYKRLSGPKRRYGRVRKVFATPGFLFILVYAVLYSYLLFLCLDCPAFCLLFLLKRRNTNVHASGGIRTRNPSKRSAEESRLVPLGH